MCISSKVLKFNFYNFQTTLDIDMVNTKIILVDMIYNFIVNKFLFIIVYSHRYLFKIIRFLNFQQSHTENRPIHTNIVGFYKIKKNLYSWSFDRQ
jgi:hypothetical protein